MSDTQVTDPNAEEEAIARPWIVDAATVERDHHPVREWRMARRDYIRKMAERWNDTMAHVVLPAKNKYRAIMQYWAGPDMHSVMKPNFDDEIWQTRSYTADHFDQFVQDCPQHALRVYQFAQEDAAHKRHSLEAGLFCFAVPWFQQRPRMTLRPPPAAFGGFFLGYLGFYALGRSWAKARAGTIGYDRRQTKRAMMWNYWRHLDETLITPADEEKESHGMRLWAAFDFRRLDLINNGKLLAWWDGPEALMPLGAQIMKRVNWNDVARRANADYFVKSDPEERYPESHWFEPVGIDDQVKRGMPEVPMTNDYQRLVRKKELYRSRGAELYNETWAKPVHAFMLEEERFWTYDHDKKEWTNEVAEKNIKDVESLVGLSRRAADWESRREEVIDRVRQRELGMFPEKVFYFKNPEACGLPNPSKVLREIRDSGEQKVTGYTREELLDPRHEWHGQVELWDAIVETREERELENIQRWRKQFALAEAWRKDKAERLAKKKAAAAAN